MTQLDLEKMRQRDGVLDALPDTIPEVKLAWFLNNLLPGIDVRAITEIVKTLGTRFTEVRPGQRTRGRTLEPAIIKGRWRWFTEEPSQSKGKEDVVYRDLDHIFDSVEAAATTVLETTLRTRTRVQTASANRSPSHLFMGNANQTLLRTTLCDRKHVGPFHQLSADSVTSWELKKERTWKQVNEVSRTS